MVNRKKTTTDKGQAHTLEGFAAGIIVLLALVVAIQSVSVTPTSSSTASQAVETRQYYLADDVLSSTAASGDLKDALLEWNDTKASFDDDLNDSEVGLRGQTYQGSNPENEFGDALERAFLSEGVAYNVDITCLDPSGGMSEKRFINNGNPSKHASTATQTIVLHQNDTLTHDANPDTELWETERFGIVCENLTPRPGDDPDDFEYSGSADSGIYNVVGVRITVWRM